MEHEAMEYGRMEDHEWGDEPIIFSPQRRFLKFFAASIQILPSFQIFYITHIALLAQQRGTIDEITAVDIKDGIKLARRNGIFDREFDSEFGQRQVACPFGNHATRWLIESMAEAGDPEQASIVQCVKKVLAERATNSMVGYFYRNVTIQMKEIAVEYAAKRKAENENGKPAAPRCPHANARRMRGEPAI